MKSEKQKQNEDGINFPSYSNEVRERRGGCEADGVVFKERVAMLRYRNRMRMGMGMGIRMRMRMGN